MDLVDQLVLLKLNFLQKLPQLLPLLFLLLQLKGHLVHLLLLLLLDPRDVRRHLTLFDLMAELEVIFAKRVEGDFEGLEDAFEDVDFLDPLRRDVHGPLELVLKEVGGNAVIPGGLHLPEHHLYLRTVFSDAPVFGYILQDEADALRDVIDNVLQLLGFGDLCLQQLEVLVVVIRLL